MQVEPFEIARWLFGALFVAASVVAAGHALLFKREPRAALGWIAVCLFFPAGGPLLYYLFGINRIKTRAKRLVAPEGTRVRHRVGPGAPPGLRQRQRGKIEAAGADAVADVLALSDLVAGAPLVSGNRVQMLDNGEAAYPEMLAAIAAARRSVYLASYIFDADRTGRRFVEALAAARQRGVRTRVLVDGVGEWYSWPRIGRLLRRAGVPFARFLPPRLVPPQIHINLRNHRKLLAVDSRTAFVGGMNIGDRHLVGDPYRGRVVDTHFRLDGPVAAHVEEVFRADWEFAAGEVLPAAGHAEAAGGTLARVIVDGPDEDLDRLATILIGAVTAARRRVWLMTPYFLPPREVMAALKAAALRGVDVMLVLPGRNNLPFVHWASRNLLWELLHWGVRVWYQPPPFVHTKLVLVDEGYAQVGSANLDARSLRLNFELSVELYDRVLGERFARRFAAVVRRSREVTIEEIEARPLWQKLRDASAWLFSPYL